MCEFAAFYCPSTSRPVFFRSFRRDNAIFADFAAQGGHGNAQAARGFSLVPADFGQHDFNVVFFHGEIEEASARGLQPIVRL